MSNATTTQTTPQQLLAEVSAESQRIIDNIADVQIGLPTPCAEYDVDRLIGHFACALRRIANAGDATPIPEWDTDESPLDPATRSVEWARSIDAGLASWADPAKLQRETELPWATVPGFAAIGMYVSEVISHTWDLAVATGQEVSFSDEAVGLAMAVMTQALPADGRVESLEATIADMESAGTARNETIPFDDAVAVGSDASPLDRLIAWTGRDPHWTA